MAHIVVEKSFAFSLFYVLQYSFMYVKSLPAKSLDRLSLKVHKLFFFIRNQSSFRKKPKSQSHTRRQQIILVLIRHDA